MHYTEIMTDNELVSGAYKLAVLFQYACAGEGLPPTLENMAEMHERTSADDARPLDRATALEYAAMLIEGAAASEKGASLDDDEHEAVEAALEALEAE